MSRSLAETEGFVCELRSEVAAMTAKRYEWLDLTTETAEQPKATKADLALQTMLWEAA